MAEVEHGLLYEKATVTKSQTRDGEKTLSLRAHYQVSEKTSNTTSIHLSMSAAISLFASLGRELSDHMKELGYGPAD